jgi:hypothetical protein
VHSANAGKADWIRYRRYGVRTSIRMLMIPDQEPFLATYRPRWVMQVSESRQPTTTSVPKPAILSDPRTSSNRFWPPCLRTSLADRLPAPIPRRQPLGKIAPSAASRLRQQLALPVNRFADARCLSDSRTPTGYNIPTATTVALVASSKSPADTRPSRRNLWHQAAADPTPRRPDSFPPQCRY